MPLPKLVYLGAADYIVREKKRMDLTTLLGETNNDNSEIFIRAKQSACSKRDTFLHEVLHAIIWLSGMGNDMDTEAEERAVRWLTPWILAFLRDNPDAVQYLLEK